jgi:alcohol dehydrogenase (quinone), cytochrome c subunit
MPGAQMRTPMVKLHWCCLGLVLMATVAQADPAPKADADVERGHYLARAADCAACHTAPGGKEFAGGLALPTPLGTIYSSNITPDPDTGIGSYTLEEFSRAVREGIAKDSIYLYPAMPFPSYAKITDADTASRQSNKPIVKAAFLFP